jgi:hypothetical protein
MVIPKKEVTTAPNPRRVEAGKRNRALRKGLTEAGRQRLREAALRHQAWKHSTGPRTPEGKARAAANGKKRQLGPLSVREIRADLAGLRGLLSTLQSTRRLVEGALSAAAGGE